MFISMIWRLVIAVFVFSAADFLILERRDRIDWPGEPAIQMQANEFDARDGTYVRPVYIHDEDGAHIVFGDADPWAHPL
jgi:hypothetical protein